MGAAPEVPAPVPLKHEAFTCAETPRSARSDASRSTPTASPLNSARHQELAQHMRAAMMRHSMHSIVFFSSVAAGVGQVGQHVGEAEEVVADE